MSNPSVPADFDVDEDPFTDEDGRGDDVDRPLLDRPDPGSPA